MHYAAMSGHLEGMKWLAQDTKADIESQDKDGWPWPNLAAINSHLEVVTRPMPGGTYRYRLEG